MGANSKPEGKFRGQGTFVMLKRRRWRRTRIRRHVMRRLKMRCLKKDGWGCFDHRSLLNICRSCDVMPEP